MANKSYSLAFMFGLWATALSMPGYTEDAAAQQAPEAKPIVIGSTTEALLNAQREGANAANLQAIPGEVASLSYRRYLDSFGKPMPEFKETVGTSTKSSSGSTQ